MEFNIGNVYERDIDLYIINKFINDSKFKELFLEKINCKNYQVCKCLHSFSDENGESDITIILENDNRKIGLLIEDKINAKAMPEQYKRYILRAEKQNMKDYLIIIIFLLLLQRVILIQIRKLKNMIIKYLMKKF